MPKRTMPDGCIPVRTANSAMGNFLKQASMPTKSKARQSGIANLTSPPIVLQVPAAGDAAQVHKLVSVCKPLDLNSTYAYLLLCHHFSDTCVVARAGKDIVGFISGYSLPAGPGTFFVWQVAVHPETRGARLGVQMLQHLLQRESTAAVSFMETTVSPSNEASRRMFQRFADSAGAPINEQMLFDRSAFGEEEHEAEVLLKIGPFARASLT
jgi:L-2,4-diaminobutyric acid acetyltransferase